MTYKAAVSRIYPTPKQEILLNKTAGCCRLVYNYFLERRIFEWKNNKVRLSYNDCSRELTQLKKNPDYKFLQEIDATALQQALRNLDTAFQRFFKQQSKYPKFNSKYARQSFRILNNAATHIVRIEENYLRCGKLGFLKIRGNLDKYHGEYDTEPYYLRSVTLSSSSSGKWYSSCLVDAEEPYFKQPELATVGIDLGVVIPLTLGYIENGKRVHKHLGTKEQKRIKKFERLRAKRQRQLARKKKGSKNYKKAKLKVAKISQKIRNIRKNALEVISDYLTKTFSIIKFEDLKLAGMTHSGGKAKAGLNRGLLRCALGELVLRTEQKAEERLSEVQFVRPHHTSQRCSKCYHIAKANRVSQSKFKCQKCGYTINADDNASWNIRAKKPIDYSLKAA